MAEGKTIAHLECRACGHRAELPEAALGGRYGRDLFRRLRCTACGMIGQAEVRLVWSVPGMGKYPDYGPPPESKG